MKSKYNFHHTLDIHCSARRVWEILTDFGRYPDWNPMIVRLEGSLGMNNKFSFTVRQTSGKRLKLSASFKKIAAPAELRWGGGVAGFLYGEHYFIIEPRGEDRCRLQHGENWSGMLMPFIWQWLEPKGKPLYPAMSEALKARAEAFTFT